MHRQYTLLYQATRLPLRQLILMLGLLFLLLLPMTASSQTTTPNLSLSPAALGTAFMYQGRLENNGTPANGQYDLRFTLYDAESGGTIVGAALDRANTTLSDGVFTVQLDFGPTAFTGAPRWLEIAVRPVGSGNLTPLSPRQALLPTPYAIYADRVDWGRIVNVPNELTDGDNVGADVNHTHVGQAWSTTGDFGLMITTDSANDADGILGVATSDQGFSAGVTGFGASPDGYGVYAENFYKGTVSKTTRPIGVAGVVTTSQGLGVLGVSLGVGKAITNVFSATGVLGITDSTSGRGVEGFARSTSGEAIGVVGSTNSFNGIGIWGIAKQSLIRVGLAGKFDGNVQVNGSVTKSGGTFKIDHPLDPANKYLYHSFVESPEMLNVYNGTAILDANGTAWVQLPPYFEALNTSFRYQLTPIGAPAPNLYVAQKVANNRFQIAGGPPNLEVSWQVTGVRQDAYARAHPIVVEEEKPADERGTYLHPTEHGQPAARGLNYHPEREQLSTAASTATRTKPSAENQP